MPEKIGKVTLDDTCYSGTDLYSEGAVEQELLEIAKNCTSEEDYNAVIAEKGSWSVLYHFSHVRHNLLSWIPFTRKDKVLEIGSGCGAVTGAFAAKAGSVTCIELSRQRSLVNAWRNRDLDHIRILLGAFEEVEKQLTEQYDYITFIGVLEYAASYTDNKDPYAYMLRAAMRHLAPGGKIVVAIENRLGLKYWAGCAEDHVGRLFEGLEGYPNTPESGARTFSKAELEQLFERAGDFKTSFYYPYPDYKLPFYIYSDKYLPRKGELKMNLNNYDQGRVLLFDESRVFDSLIDNGLFPQFSNSFLVFLERRNGEAAAADEQLLGDIMKKSMVIFSKYSNERNRRFAIRTDILEDADGRRCIRKVPEYPEGEAHVQALFHWYETFSAAAAGTKLAYNRCRLIHGGAELEYLTGISLEEHLLTVEKEQGTDACAQKFLEYLNFVRSIHVGAVFGSCREFFEVFGDAAPPAGTVCAPCTNIDLLCENILLCGESWTAIDYEWSFSFPIPVNFLLFRIIFYFTAHANRGTEFECYDFYGKMGITAEEIEAYEKMETHFQHYVCGSHVPIRDLYDTISEGFFQIKDQPAREVLQVYFDYGEGFREECSNRYYMKHRGNWCIRQEVLIPDNVSALRVDPGSRACMVRLKTLRFDNQQTSAHFRLREGVVQGEWLCFTEDDPNIILRKIPHGAKSLLIDLELYEVARTAGENSGSGEQSGNEVQEISIFQKIATAALRSG